MFKNTCHCSYYIVPAGFRGQTQFIFFDFFVLYLFRFTFSVRFFGSSTTNLFLKPQPDGPFVVDRAVRIIMLTTVSYLSYIHWYMKPSVSIIKIVIINASLLNYDVASHHMCTCNTYFDIYMRKYYKALRKDSSRFYIIFGTELCNALPPLPLFLFCKHNNISITVLNH